MANFALDINSPQGEIISSLNYALVNLGSGSANVANALIANPNGSITNSTSGSIISWQYRWINVRYATNATGSVGFSTVPTNATYYGIQNTPDQTPSTVNNPANYTWTQVAGGFGTTKFLFYQTRGGYQIGFYIGVGNPGQGYQQTTNAQAIDLTILTVATGAAGTNGVSASVTPSQIIFPQNADGSYNIGNVIMTANFVANTNSILSSSLYANCNSTGSVTIQQIASDSSINVTTLNSNTAANVLTVIFTQSNTGVSATGTITTQASFISNTGISTFNVVAYALSNVAPYTPLSNTGSWSFNSGVGTPPLAPNDYNHNVTITGLSSGYANVVGDYKFYTFESPGTGSFTINGGPAYFDVFMIGGGSSGVINPNFPYNTWHGGGNAGNVVYVSNVTLTSNTYTTSIGVNANSTISDGVSTLFNAIKGAPVPAAYPYGGIGALPTFAVTNGSVSGGSATLFFNAYPTTPFLINEIITVSGVTPGPLNGTWSVTAANTNSVSYGLTGTYSSVTGGNINLTSVGSKYVGGVGYADPFRQITWTGDIQSSAGNVAFFGGGGGPGIINSSTVSIPYGGLGGGGRGGYYAYPSGVYQATQVGKWGGGGGGGDAPNYPTVLTSDSPGVIVLRLYQPTLGNTTTWSLTQPSVTATQQVYSSTALARTSNVNPTANVTNLTWSSPIVTSSIAIPQITITYPQGQYINNSNGVYTPTPVANVVTLTANVQAVRSSTILAAITQTTQYFTANGNYIISSNAATAYNANALVFSTPTTTPYTVYQPVTYSDVGGTTNAFISQALLVATQGNIGPAGIIPLAYIVANADPTTANTSVLNAMYSAPRNATYPPGPIGVGFAPLAKDVAQFFQPNVNSLSGGITSVQEYDGTNWSPVTAQVVSGGLIVTGTITTSQLNANEVWTLQLQSTNATFGDPNSAGFWLASQNGDARFAGNTSIGANLQVGINANIAANLRVGINANIGANLTVGGNLSVGTNASIGRNLTISSNAVIGGNLTIGNNAVIGGNLTIGDNVGIGDNLRVGLNSNIGANASIGGNLSVGINANIGANLSVGGNASIGTNLRIGSNATIAGNLTVGNNAVIGGNLTVLGLITAGNLVANSVTTGSITPGSITSNLLVPTSTGTIAGLTQINEYDVTSPMQNVVYSIPYSGITITNTAPSVKFLISAFNYENLQVLPSTGSNTFYDFYLIVQGYYPSGAPMPAAAISGGSIGPGNVVIYQEPIRSWNGVTDVINSTLPVVNTIIGPFTQQGTYSFNVAMAYQGPFYLANGNPNSSLTVNLFASLGTGITVQSVGGT